MLKEAIIWAALLTGIACSWYVFVKALSWRIDTEKPTTLYFIIGSMFMGLVYAIYFLFRFFSYLAHVGSQF
jgi:hypothetical protein